MSEQHKAFLFLLIFFGSYAGVGYWCIWKSKKW